MCRLSSGSSTLSRVLEGGQPRKPWQMWPRTGSLRRAELARTTPETGSHKIHPTFPTRLSSHNSARAECWMGGQPKKAVADVVEDWQSAKRAAGHHDVVPHDISTYLLR